MVLTQEVVFHCVVQFGGHSLLCSAAFCQPLAQYSQFAVCFNAKMVNSNPTPAILAHYIGDVRVLEGHAFIVEAAVSLGGNGMKPGINVFRYANRIPLLFEVRCIVLRRV